MHSRLNRWLPAARTTVLTALLATGLAASGLVAAPAATAADPTAVDSGPAARRAVSFEVASFNVLGSQHTVRSNRWRPGNARARMARRWLDREGVSVAGTQEGQVGQMRRIVRGGRWQAFPDPRRSTSSETAQSVVWRRAHWRLVRAESFRIPFNYGQVRKQPVVLLKQRQTGRRIWVTSVHLTSGRNPRAAKERRIGTRRLARTVTRLHSQTRVPVIVTGDMNDHGEFFCRLSTRTGLRSPAGGWADATSGCTPPQWMRIDWLFGTPGLAWSDFRYAEDSYLDRVTDHAVPVARVLVS